MSDKFGTSAALEAAELFARAMLALNLADADDMAPTAVRVLASDDDNSPYRYAKLGLRGSLATYLAAVYPILGTNVMPMVDEVLEAWYQSGESIAHCVGSITADRRDAAMMAAEALRDN